VETFVVRVYVLHKPAAGARDGLRGVVEHVGSARSTPFENEVQLLAFLSEARLTEAAARPQPSKRTSVGGDSP
jgi:hypothetical protein